MGAGLVAGLLGVGTRSLPALAEDDPGAISVLDVCFWETRQTRCRDGRKEEYRCEVCCGGGYCETVQCIWVDVGPC